MLCSWTDCYRHHSSQVRWQTMTNLVYLTQRYSIHYERYCKYRSVVQRYTCSQPAEMGVVFRKGAQARRHSSAACCAVFTALMLRLIKGYIKRISWIPTAWKTNLIMMQWSHHRGAKTKGVRFNETFGMTQKAYRSAKVSWVDITGSAREAGTGIGIAFDSDEIQAIFSATLTHETCETPTR